MDQSHPFFPKCGSIYTCSELRPPSHAVPSVEPTQLEVIQLPLNSQWYHYLFFKMFTTSTLFSVYLCICLISFITMNIL